MGAIDGLIKALKDGVQNQYAQGAPYRKAMIGALQGNFKPADQLFNTPQPVDPNEAVNAAMTFAPMGLGTIGKAASLIPKTQYELAHELAQKNAVDMLGLPANNTAMDRANAMGFNKQGYHGTNADIKAFDNDKAAQGITWFAEHPNMAGDYASSTGSGGNVIPLMAKLQNPADWKAYDNLGLSEFNRNGHDGAWLPSSSNESSGFVMNPNQLRSKFAAFDPAKASSPDLLGNIRPDLAIGMGASSLAGLAAYNQYKK